MVPPPAPDQRAVRRSALEAGASGCALSGSGPTIVGLCATPQTADAVRQAMVDAFGRHGVQSVGHVSPLSADGARLAHSPE